MKSQGLAGGRKGEEGRGGVFLFFCLLTLADPCSPLLTPVFCEELTVQASVNKTEVRSDQKLVYSIAIAGALAEPPKVQLSGFEGFRVISTGQSQELQIHRGKKRQALILSYTLAPTAAGTHTLGPVKVEYEGQMYETQPIEVTVLPQGIPPRDEPDMKKLQDPDVEGGFIL